MASRYTFVYFVFVLMIQAVFVASLLIGVVISIFNKEHQKISQSSYLTNLEYEYIDTCIQCLNLKPLKAFTQKAIVRKFCYFITDSKIFKNFVHFCILANTVTLACTWYD